MERHVLRTSAENWFAVRKNQKAILIVADVMNILPLRRQVWSVIQKKKDIVMTMAVMKPQNLKNVN